MERHAQVQMTRLTLVVDERELSTIRAALLLLQEQINALPEDLADMMSERGAPLTEREVGRLAHRLASGSRPLSTSDGAGASEMVVEVERTPQTIVALT
jgi:hypothetical protein